MTVTCYVDDAEVSCDTWEPPDMRDELLGLLKEIEKLETKLDKKQDKP